MTEWALATWLIAGIAVAVLAMLCIADILSSGDGPFAVRRYVKKCADEEAVNFLEKETDPWKLECYILKNLQMTKPVRKAFEERIMKLRHSGSFSPLADIPYR